ncbi:MAG TPA: restriction endonuclease subunit S [Mesotoga sp.]|nr:restriction endonuclease subunit S [Mesotoga sp.]HPM95166.1 restriction endonuclease subunit S [Mesotoga sp.]
MRSENFSLKPLASLANIYDSMRIPVKKADRKPGPYPYYGASGIVDYVDSYIFDGEYLLLAEDGENLRSQNLPIAFMATGKFWVNNHAHILQGKNGNNTLYLCYALKIADIGSYLSGSTRPKLTQRDMKRISVSCADPEEQHAIAHILGSLDDKIELNRRMNQTLQAMARAIFKHWFIDFEFPNENGEPYKSSGGETINSPLGPIPKGWRIGRIEDVCEFSYGKALKADKRIQGRIPVYGSNGQIGWHNESLVSGPGIIVGRKGNPGLIHWSKEDFFPIDTTFYVVPRVGKSIMHFLYFALKHVDLPRLSADSAVPGLNRNIAYMQQLVIPTEQLLRDFENRISIIFDLLQTNCWQNQSLSELRDSLLPKLVSGEIRVPVSEKEDDQL